jgi:phosphoribosylanthranilate isomerase
MTWIKICGTTTLEDAQLALRAGADAIGFVFAPSRRQVALGEVRDIVAKLPQGPDFVGVFVNESEEGILEIVRGAGLTAVQLHGDETAEFAFSMRAKLPDKKLFRAIPFSAVAGDGGQGGKRWSVEGPCDGWLLDGAPKSERGGAGISFDWRQTRTALAATQWRENVIVAGGLHPENVAEALQVLRPWGVDVVSGVEAEPGRKDADKVRAFVRAVREWESGLSHGNG